MSRAAHAAAVLFLAFIACTALAASRDVPFLTGRVVDNAEVLSAGAAERITALLRGHEQKTTDQMAVLTVRSLGGESIEEYAVDVFESWKLGQKGKDNVSSSSSCRPSARCESKSATVSKGASPTCRRTASSAT